MCCRSKHHLCRILYSTYKRYPWRRAWQPTPVFLPGESSWTEEPGGLQSIRLQRVGHDWATKHISDIAWPFSVRLTSLSMIISSPCCCKWHYVTLFNGWAIFPCIYAPHLLYPSICGWTLRLLLCPGFCKWCWSEHRGACVFMNHY